MPVRAVERGRVAVEGGYAAEEPDVGWEGGGCGCGAVGGHEDGEVGWKDARGGFLGHFGAGGVGGREFTREICLSRAGWDEEGMGLEVAPDNREWGDLLFSCT